MTDPGVAPGTKDISSISSLKTEKSANETAEHSLRTFVPENQESTPPEDSKEETLETLQDDWETDPENARNWPTHRRWIAMLIVRWTIYGSLLSHQPLSMTLGFILYTYSTFS